MDYATKQRETERFLTAYAERQSARDSGNRTLMESADRRIEELLTGARTASDATEDLRRVRDAEAWRNDGGASWIRKTDVTTIADVARAQVDNSLRRWKEQRKAIENAKARANLEAGGYFTQPPSFEETDEEKAKREAADRESDLAYQAYLASRWMEGNPAFK